MKYAGKRIFVACDIDYESNLTITKVNKNYTSKIDYVRDIINKINDAEYVVICEQDRAGLVRMLAIEFGKEVKII